MNKIHFSAPGRICLFGEDVDYMGLESIVAGINRRVHIKALINNHSTIHVNLLDKQENYEFKFARQELHKRDYIKSAFNMYFNKFPDNFGATISIYSSLPIGKGLSSSSALCSALIALFDYITKTGSSKEEIAKRAYEAEVVSLNEAGGMMDHFATSIGQLLYIVCRKPIYWKNLSNNIKGLLICDTLESKETVYSIKKRKQQIYKGIEFVKRNDRTFDIVSYPFNKTQSLYHRYPKLELKRLLGILGIRDIVRAGYKLLNKPLFDEHRFAELINRHHHFQENFFDNVTSRMKRYVKIANENGAQACKLLGSGHGGCFLIFAPTKKAKIKEALKNRGAKTFEIKIDEGIKKHK